MSPELLAEEKAQIDAWIRRNRQVQTVKNARGGARSRSQEGLTPTMDEIINLRVRIAVRDMMSQTILHDSTPCGRTRGSRPPPKTQYQSVARG